YQLWGPLLLIILLFPIGIYCYQKNRLENNGKVILFTSLQRFFLSGIVACSALMAGGYLTTIFSPGITFRPIIYYIGFIGGGIVSYLITKLLVNKRFRFL